MIVDWQEATYYYANAAPQWQTVNNGNWRALEAAVRDKARRAGSDLEIYTGTIGVLRLRAENGTDEELWLATSKDKKYIPVPEYFFKVIFYFSIVVINFLLLVICLDYN